MLPTKRRLALQEDVRHALRMVGRARAFTTAAVLTLAIGIAGTTVVFALIQGVLLRPLPVREQDRLIVVWKEMPTAGSAQYPFGDVEIQAAVRSSRLLESAAGVTRNGVYRAVIGRDRGAHHANVGLITGGFFEVLGVRPLLGRVLTTADDREGAEQAVVISHGFWEREYGAAPDAIGRRIRLNELPFTIVGVMPSDLDYPTGVEIWRTTRSVPTTGPFGDAARREVNLIGRLRPGVTIEQAASELAVLSPRLDDEAPSGSRRGLRPVVRAFADVVVGDVRRPILALFGAVVLVLLIAVANVANLLLMRGESRRQEMALRAALGAGRARLARIIFAEGLMISALAGIVGIAVAQVSLRTLIAFVPEGLPRADVIGIEPSVILFAMVTVAAATLLAGLAPTLLTRYDNLASTLRGGPASTAAVTTVRGRRLLVVVQVALAITVLAATGLLTRSVLQLQAVDLGLPVRHLALVELQLPPKYDERQRHEQFLDDAMAALESIPSIESVTPVNGAPFTGYGWDVPRFAAEGQSADVAAANPSLHLESIHPNYFETFQVAMRHGRAFVAADRAGALDVAIVSEDVAAGLWPGRDPIGKRIKMGGLDPRGPWLTIVGVAAQTRYRTVFGPRPTLYLPAAQFQMTATFLAVRSRVAAGLLTSLARERLRALDGDVQVIEVARFEDLLAVPMARPRFNAWLLGVFGAAALVLSAVGLYAVMAAFVRQRDRELAIRMALGATASDMRRFVLAEAGRLGCLGALAGAAGAVAASRVLRGMLFEIHPLDPVALSSAAALLVGAAAIASYLPVRRATRADAVSVLRSQ